MAKKKQSKRMTTRKRTKIERKVREHNRNLKKTDRKRSGKVKRKDPGIPNSLPFKENILREAEEHKQQLEQKRLDQKEKTRKEREKLVNKKRNLDHLVKDAQKRTDNFNKKNHIQKTAPKELHQSNPESSLKAYYKEFKKVVDAADVILEVLDARDPLGSRCPQVEEAVLSAGYKKKLVLLLNKIDLVPKENVENWLKYLRNEFPTLAFKASTQTQAENLSQVRTPVIKAGEDLLKSSRCLGADMVMKLLGNYCRNQSIRSAITVGVVGFPNTGKSSIINSLKRSKACNVGATPGITKTMQPVQLDKHIKLLDSPGIVMATGTSDAAIILRNCVKIETVDDPASPVAAILKRCSKHQMMLHYNIPVFSDVNEFLALLAKRFGRLKKGGIPDINKAARTVLQDWNQGKITYYTHPPESSSMATHVSAEIVSKMSEGFDIQALLEEEKKALEGLKTRNTTDIVMETAGPTDGLIDEEMARNEDVEDINLDEESDEEMEDEEESKEETEELKQVTVSMATERSRTSSTSTEDSKGRRKKKDKKKKKDKSREEPYEGLLQMNKARKNEFKKMKKERRRADALGDKLGTALEDAFAGLGGQSKSKSEDYNFATDFKL